MITKTFVDIFHFYTGVYLWRKTNDGKLVNKHYQRDWIYGNKTFIFIRTVGNIYSTLSTSAFNGICFLADK